MSAVTIISTILSLGTGVYMILCLLGKLAVPAFVLGLFADGVLFWWLEQWTDWAPWLFALLFWAIAICFVTGDLASYISGESSGPTAFGASCIGYLIVNGIKNPVFSPLFAKLPTESGIVVSALFMIVALPFICLIAGIAVMSSVQDRFDEAPSILLIPLGGIACALIGVLFLLLVFVAALLLTPVFWLFDKMFKMALFLVGAIVVVIFLLFNG